MRNKDEVLKNLLLTKKIIQNKIKISTKKLVVEYKLNGHSNELFRIDSNKKKLETSLKEINIKIVNHLNIQGFFLF